MADYGSGKLLLTGATNTSLTYNKDIETHINALMASMPATLTDNFNKGLEYLSNATYEANASKLDSFRQGGEAAMQQALALQGIGSNPMNGDQVSQYFQNTPGFQFQMDQGKRLAESSAASKGQSGPNLLKALTQYGQGIAAQQFGSRQQELANLAQIGLSAGQSQLQGAGANNQAAAQLQASLGTGIVNSQLQAEQLRTSAQAGALNTNQYSTEQGHVMKMLESAAGR